MKRIILAACVVLLAGAVAAPAADEPKEKKDDKPVVVPFEVLKTKHMAVKIKVNGKGPYRVIFDTGAPMTVLSGKLAKEAGLLGDAPKPAISLFGTGGPAKVKSLEVGDLKAEDVPVVVMDHPTVGALAMLVGGSLDGIVGYPFFARYKMTIDYKDEKLTFVPSGYEPPDVLQIMMASVMGGGPRDKVKVLAPAAQWGFAAGKEKEDDEPGVTVKEVMPGGAAEKAGLKAGDRVLTLDGRWTDTLPDLYAAAGYVKAGTAVKVVVKRDGKEVTLTVKPASGL
jgi:hypothetical protein